MDKRGFSLIEVVVTVSIIGIMLGLASPNLLVWMKKEKVRSAASEISSAFLLSRSKAVSSGMEYRVGIDKRLKHLKIDKGNAFSGSSLWSADRPNKVLPGDENLQVSFSTGQSKVFPGDGVSVFRPDGTVVNGNGVMLDNDSSVTITDGETTFEVVIVSSRTGHVVVREVKQLTPGGP